MDVVARRQRARNRARIRAIARASSDDLDALTHLFEDDHLLDDGTLAGRLRALFDATERRLIPGLQTALPFGDTGFAGDRRPGGAGFRDPWPSSRNQVGHFLTALRLRWDPAIVARPIPILGSIRAIVGAPPDMTDAQVAVRLAIGHEKAPDPRNALPASCRVLAAGAATGACLAPFRVRRSARYGAVAATVALAALRQARAILRGFQAQFSATTADDLAAWEAALRRCGPDVPLDRRLVEGADTPLAAIAVGAGVGNSIQDLRLTFVGWRLGQLIATGALTDRRAVGAWIRRALAPEDAPSRPDPERQEQRTPRRPGYRRAAIAYAIADSPLSRLAITLYKRVTPAPRLAITRYEVVVPRLPGHLDGLRILHLSDLHVHPGSNLAWQMPDLVASAPHDLLCYTGDFIDVDGDIPRLATLLSLMPPSRAYAVLGNHDYIPFGRAHGGGANDSRALRATLAAAGIRVLTNQAVPLFDGALYLAGVDDPATGRDDLGATLAAVPDGACTLLLAHSPDVVLRLDARRPDLVLAGHTHGGQVRLPLVGMLITMSQLPRHLVTGLVNYEGTPLFTSRGIGYSGLPIRYGSPPEAALLTLRSAPLTAPTSGRERTPAAAPR